MPGRPTASSSKHLPGLDAISQYEAVALFIQRASAAAGSFTVTNENAPAVAEICSRLDGLPLAIELAAARIKLFPPQALLRRLSKQLELLTGGAKDRPTRQHTLRNTIDWSHSLLTPEEQALFARLAIFAGGCTFEAAEAVCNLGGNRDLLEGIASLMDKSLLRRDGVDDEPRFSMLQSIREYAIEKLDERGEAETIRAAHAQYFLHAAEAAEPALSGPMQGESLELLEGELNNVRAALKCFLQEERTEEELRLVSALFRFWFSRGYWSEARQWLEAGLIRSDGVAPRVRSKALMVLGILAYHQGDYERATLVLQQALDLFRELADRKGSARALNILGVVAGQQARYEQANALLTEGLQLSHELEDRGQSARALGNLGWVAREQGNWTTARQRFNEALTIFRTVGDEQSIAIALGNLGEVAVREGNLEEGETRLEESLALARELGEKGQIAQAIWNLGDIARVQGHQERARECLREGLLLARELGDRHLTLDLVATVAALAVARGNAEHAARLRGAEAAARETFGIPVPSLDNAERHQTLVQARALLGEGDFTRAWERGQAMSLAETVAYALDEDSS